MLSINIERIWANSRLILTMTTIIIYRFFIDVQIHNIFHKLIQFHLCKFYAQKKKVLVVLGSVKFQFPIISLVNFCNYSLLFVIRVKRVVISGSFRVDTNKLACQTCLLRVTRVDSLITRFLSCCFRVDPFMTQTH